MHNQLTRCGWLVAALTGMVVAAGCAGPGADGRPRYAIAIHGGAGFMDPATTTPEQRAAHLAALRGALQAGRDILARDGSALDACEAAIRLLEDDPKFNAGRGAVYTETGGHELDASIMDGATLKAGAVAGVRTVKNPISLARQVMQRTRHVLLAGDGAEAFAGEVGAERVPNSYFDTEGRRKDLERVLEERRREAAPATAPAASAAGPRRDYLGTVGCVALDARGNLAAGTSTGGLTGKRWGRVGDSPIIGAGTYANRVCAVSCTGIGEQFIRHGVARDVAALMEYKGYSAQRAGEELIRRRLNPEDGGLIVVDSAGRIAFVYSTPNMARGAADSTGRFEVGIWQEME